MADISDRLYPALLEDPRFQNLLAKAETHQRKFRPRETARLERQGRLIEVLQERAQSCWESLSVARNRGLTLIEAQEEASPMILLPDEDSPED